VADVRIGGDVVVHANGNTGASASVSQLYADANGTGAQARVVIGGEGGGNVVMHAEAANGSASISVEYVYAAADGANAQAVVDITRDLRLTAEGSQASAEVSSVYAQANNGAQAELHIGGNLALTAQADNGATASLSSVYAQAGTGSQARLTIGGALSVTAQGGSSASAGISSVYANASGDGALAQVDIGLGVAVQALAGTGSASASLSGIMAEAGGALATAQVSIDNGVVVVAQGHNANAGLSTVSATASGLDSFAQVEINGGVAVQAHAMGGDAYASMSGLTAEATGVGSTARVDINGNYAALATVDDAQGVLNDAVRVSASAGSVSVYANAANADAQVSISGDMSAQALAWGKSYVSASAAIEEMGVSAQGVSSNARFSIGGDLRVVATVYGSNNGLIEPNHLRAEASVYSISVEANADHANASLDIGGSIEVRAQTSGDDAYAEASMSSVSVSADGVGAQAQLTIGDGANVWADAGMGARGHAEASFSGFSADARQEGAKATITINGDLVAGARANGADAVASASFSSLYAWASDGALANITVSGSLETSAVAGGANAYADASADGLYAHGNVSATADVTLMGHLGVFAMGTGIDSDAEATLRQLSADAYGGNVAASVHTGGAIDVQAIAAGNAEASFWQVDASASGTQGQAQVEVAGDVTVVASGQNATAELQGHWMYWIDNAINHAEAGLQAHTNGTGAQSQVSMDGNVNVVATGADSAAATFGGISAEALDGGLAQVSVAGDLTINALAGLGGTANAVLGQYSQYWSNAHGYVQRDHNGLMVSAGGNVQAYADIGDDVLVNASGPDGATAALYGATVQADAGNVHGAFSSPAHVYGDAGLHIGGDLSVTASGVNGDAAASLYRMQSEVDPGDSNVFVHSDTTLQVDGNVTVSASGAGDADVFGGIYSASGHGAALSFGTVDGSNVHLGGDATFSAQGGGNVSVQAGFFADDGGNVSVHDVSVAANSSGDGDLMFLAGAYDGGSLHMDSLDVSLASGGAGSGTVILGADSSANVHAGSDAWGNAADGTLDIDALRLMALTDDDSLNVWVDHMDWEAGRTATLYGQGDISMAQGGGDDGLHGGGFAVIDASNFNGHLAFSEVLDGDADIAATGLSSLNHYTFIKGFDVAKDTVGFGNLQVDAGSWHDVVGSRDTDGLAADVAGSAYAITSSEFASAGAASSEAALFAALNLALDGDTDVAYAKYTGNVSLAGLAGTADDAQHDLYAVAYDVDGTGITSVILVQVADGANFDGNVVIGHSAGA
ncbi:beta strand repeat-containing protein, partial [Azohydromonas lata]|uniref:beta strand repeat-containing protein n=1 Tax=Azohydromonas lata TaxID=45677 RepID=UPI00147154ED